MSDERHEPPTWKAEAEKPDMRDAEPRASMAATAADVMWAWPLAAARVADTFLSLGWAFWPRLLRPAAGPLMWPLAPGFWWASRGPFRPKGGRNAGDVSGSGPEESGFASYRSPGGHAAAQIVPPR
jgi:hypothetical protein